MMFRQLVSVTSPGWLTSVTRVCDQIVTLDDHAEREKRRNNSSNTRDDPIHSLIVTAKPIVRGGAGVPIPAYAIF
jgi:hypothetical protein